MKGIILALPSIVLMAYFGSFAYGIFTTISNAITLALTIHH